MTSRPETERVHIVIRLGSSARTGLAGDPLEEHDRIARTQGSVLFGKFGRGLAASKLNAARRAIALGMKLIVVRRTGTGFEGFGARVVQIHAGNFTPVPSLIPAYYHALIPSATLWFEVGHFCRMSHRELAKLVLVSNGRPLLDTLSTCRTPLMIVREG